MLDVDHDEPIEAILFDLDGTLLRVQMEHFIPRYVERLAAYFANDIKPETFSKVMIFAIRKLIATTGDGRLSNEERFHALLEGELGLSPELFAQGLDYFARNHLEELKAQVHAIPLAIRIVKECHLRGIPLVLATNPVFPRFMIDARMRWGGLDLGLFSHVTSYENSRYCKPQAGYFQDIAQMLELPPQRCLMIGNDSSHDLAAVATGMRAFLVDTWLVERDEPRWPSHYRGDHSTLQRFLRTALS